MPTTGFNTKLTWKNFRELKSRPAGKSEDAETFSGYNAPNITFKRSANAVVVDKADVKISIDSRQSWVLQGKKTNDLLQHEQGHYDISALAANEFYNKLMKLQAPDAGSLDKAIQAENDAMQQKMNNANVRYDQQTNHSQVKTIQAQWDKAIATEKAKPDGSIDNLP